MCEDYVHGEMDDFLQTKEKTIELINSRDASLTFGKSKIKGGPEVLTRFVY